MRIVTNIHYCAAILLAAAFLAGCSKDSQAPRPTGTAPSTKPSTTEEMVLTPAGYMPKSSTHFVEPGTELGIVNGRIQKFESVSGKMLQDFGPVTITEDPVHSTTNGGSFEQSLSSTTPAVFNGWAAYTFWANPDTTNPITFFSSNWVVPDAPADTSRQQTIFIFDGMQDGTKANSYIIQPVLQFGPSAAGGGEFWAVTNWFVSSKQTFYGTLKAVKTGKILQGVMTETVNTGKKFDYTSSFTGLPKDVSIKVKNVPQAFWCAETLEVYGVKKADQYPDDKNMVFSGIQILQGTTNAPIDWTPVAATTKAKPNAVVISNGSPDGAVTINF
jgi:hypothetical protein